MVEEQITWGVRLHSLMLMESDTIKCVEKSLDIRTKLLMHFKDSRAQLIKPMSMESASLTDVTPRKHIWTFAAAVGEVDGDVNYKYPCTNVHQTSPQPPSFVESDYFCDTGSTHRYQYIFYPDDPLWDGAGCGPASTCCSLNNPPWFYKQLPTATRDSIEMRICSDQVVSNEDTPVEIIEL